MRSFLSLKKLSAPCQICNANSLINLKICPYNQSADLENLKILFELIKYTVYNYHIMKFRTFRRVAKLLIAAGTLSACAISHSATFIVEFPNNADAHLDPYYNTLDENGHLIHGDQNSYVFDGVAVEGNVSANLSGRYYDSDPLDPGTMGLLNSDLPWNRTDEDVPQPGWLVRYGLKPDSVGQMIHTHDPGGEDEVVVPASYLSFHVDSPDTVVFSEVSLVIKDIVGVGPSTIWAATSKDNFTDVLTGVQVFSDETGLMISWKWTDLELSGKGFEVRVYGFVGADEGTFGTGLVTGIVDPPPVPETSTALLTGCAAMILVTSRKRRLG